VSSRKACLMCKAGVWINNNRFWSESTTHHCSKQVIFLHILKFCTGTR
jgi:hypothetical protein